MNIFAQRTWYNRHIVGHPTLLTHDGRNPACIYYLKLAGNVFRTFEPAKAMQFLQMLGRVTRRSEPNVSAIRKEFTTPNAGTPTAK